MTDAPSAPANPSTPLSLTHPAFANVIIPRHLNRSFTYAIPAYLQGRLGIGSRVLVPFGSARLQGVIVSLFPHLPIECKPVHSGTSPVSARLREILSQVDESPESSLPADLLALSRMISERYLAPWGQCLRLILPPAPQRKSFRYALTDSGRALLDKPDDLERLSMSVRMVLSRLARGSKGLSGATLQQTLRRSFRPTLSSLTRRGFVRKIDNNEARADRRRIRRPDLANPVHRLPDSDRARSEPARLSASQEMPDIRSAIAGNRYAPFMLQTPADRRSDDLMQAVECARLHRRTVLIITPEIARAEALIARLKSSWATEAELFHGALSSASRAALWARVRQGRIRLLVGTRSAIFSPFSSLGLLCIEDEHDPSLKEETEPQYHVREVATWRAQQHNAVLLLLSSHPSLEAVYAHRPMDNDPKTVEGHHRGKSVFSCSSTGPIIHSVDLRREPYDTLLSEPMLAGIQAALDARAGVLLFLNRKGFAAALRCRECGIAPQCPQCSIALTFYKQAGRLTCRYCGTSLSLPDACPSCMAARLEPMGAGTERVEAAIRRLFPKAKIGRLDREVSRAQVEMTRRQVLAGEVEILIGTQMLFRGEPLPPVGFVGLIHADAGLHLPDFRAGERTFHTLMDAVAMAHSENTPGKVVLQTYLPAHHAIAAVVEHNPAVFYEQELAFRRMLAYPPFGHLIGLRVTGRQEDRVIQAAERWAAQLRTAGKEHRGTGQADSLDVSTVKDNGCDVTVLGPVPSAITQLRGRYRWQLLVKSVSAEAARATVRTTLDDLERVRGRAGLKYEVDVDPVTML